MRRILEALKEAQLLGLSITQGTTELRELIHRAESLVRKTDRALDAVQALRRAAKSDHH